MSVNGARELGQRVFGRRIKGLRGNKPSKFGVTLRATEVYDREKRDGRQE